MQNVASRVAVGESSWLCERRKVEPMRRSGIRDRARSNTVGPLAGGPVVGHVAAQHRRERRPAAVGIDARNLPSTKYAVDNGVGVAEHAVSVAEGKAIHRTYRKDMFEVVVALRIGAGKQAKSDWCALVAAIVQALAITV